MLFLASNAPPRSLGTRSATKVAKRAGWLLDDRAMPQVETRALRTNLRAAALPIELLAALATKHAACGLRTQTADWAKPAPTSAPTVLIAAQTPSLRTCVLIITQGRHRILPNCTPRKKDTPAVCAT